LTIPVTRFVVEKMINLFTNNDTFQ
jgi:hypothetical protein